MSNQSIADLVNDSLVALTDKVPELNKDILAIMAYTLGQCPDQYIVSEYDVYTVLSKLNMHKATLFDCIDNSLLRVLAPDLAAPICSLINASIRQGFVPRQWKLSRITLVPKSIRLRILKGMYVPSLLHALFRKLRNVLLIDLLKNIFMTVLILINLETPKADQP